MTKGKISFRYLVDSEDIYDGMSFSINGKEYIEKVGNVQNLETFTQELDRGYYTFQWKYSKDYSTSYGADAAYIQRLEILGTQYADENCVKCDAGTYNNASGTGECYRCPRNTYAAEDGATACEACPAGTFSTIGASECLARRACTLDDVTFHYTPCELRDGAPVRDLVYEWPESTDCDYTSEEAKKLLPAAQHGLPCGDCNPGTARSTTTGACEYCGADMASDGRVGSVCAACPTGTHPAYGLYFNQWSESSVLDAFVTNCTGQCNAAGAGWEIANTSIMSGSGNGLTYVTTLEISFNATEDTTITFSYSIHINDKDTVECVLAYNEVGGESHVLYMPYLEPIANTTYRLSAGHHHIRFVFSSVTKNATAQNYARIYSIAIPYAVLTHGPLAGVVGGSECVPCAQGSFSTGGKAECALCAPGYSSDEGASECSLCPENTFNDVAGGICRSCGNAVSTPAGSEQCPLDCVYSPDNNKTLYDIRSLFK